MSQPEPQSHMVKHAKDLRVLTFEPRTENLGMMSRGLRRAFDSVRETEDGIVVEAGMPEMKHRSAGMLERSIEGMGCNQTVVETLHDMIDQLEAGKDNYPDAVIIHDSSVPIECVGHMSMGMRVPVHLQDMHGIQALKLLKHPESPYRNIPVIIFRVYPDAGYYFEEHGADDVVLSDRMSFGANGLEYALSNVLGVEEIVMDGWHGVRRHYGCDDDGTERKRPEFYRPVTAFVDTTNPTRPHLAKSKEDQPVIKGEQLHQFRNLIMRERSKYASPEGVENFLRRGDFENIKYGRVHIACEADLCDRTEVSNALNRIVMRIAQVVIEQEINCQDKAIAAINHACKVEGVQEQGLVWFMAVMMLGDAFESASKKPAKTGLYVEYTDAARQALVSFLHVQIAELEYTESFGVAEAAKNLIEMGAQIDADKLAAIDEKAMGIAAASTLRTLAVKIRDCCPETSEDVLHLFDDLRGAESGQSIAMHCLTKVMEGISDLPFDEKDQLSAQEIRALRARLDAAAQSDIYGCKTQALCFELSERMFPEMTIDSLQAMIGTLSNFEKFGGGDSSYPKTNVLKLVARAIYDIRGQSVFGEYAPQHSLAVRYDNGSARAPDLA